MGRQRNVLIKMHGKMCSLNVNHGLKQMLLVLSDSWIVYQMEYVRDSSGGGQIS